MLVVDKQKYKMAIYEAKKEVHVQVHGFIKDDIVGEYLADLQETVNKVSKQSYTFFVDATYQSPVPTRTVAQLGETLMSYTTLGFKDIVIIIPKSKIAFVQVRNALEKVDFPGKIIDNNSMK